MLITLLRKDKIARVNLPGRCSGRYWIENLVCIEADERREEWYIRSGRGLKIYNEDREAADKVYLADGETYLVSFGTSGADKGFIVAGNRDDSVNTYTRYTVEKDGEIRIGRDPNAGEIVIDNPYVGSIHCAILRNHGVWKLFDNGSANGVYVNDVRETEKILRPGDVVYVLGVKIIIGDDYLAVNNPGGSVRIAGEYLKRQAYNNTVAEREYEEIQPEIYRRTPRFVRSAETLKLRVDMPPQKEREDEIPMALTLAPAMLMGVASFSTGLFTMVNARASGGDILATLPSLVMSIAMLCGMVVFPFIVKKIEKKNRQRKEQVRQQKYTKYINQLRAEIGRNKKMQEEILRENNPDIVQKTSSADFWVTGLWSKNSSQKDFLYLRLGLGNLPMDIDTHFPEEKFTIDDDVMRDELLSFQAEEQLLFDVPVGIDLKKYTYVGMVMNSYQVLHNIVMQLALLHGYDEVKLIVISDPHDLKKLPYLKKLKALWSDDESVRYLASTEEAVKELNSSVGKILGRQKEYGNSKAPYYVVIITSMTHASEIAFLEELKEEYASNFRVIYCYNDTKDLPRECELIVRTDSDRGMLYGRESGSYNGISFIQDKVPVEVCNSLADVLGHYQLPLDMGQYSLPTSLSFMDMLEVGKCEHLNILHRWEENDPSRSLKAPVGYDINGNLMYLDLHEKGHGPHGLVAGTTGSGKSEFIITYILSMAVHYHPHEVAFVLIDYKGGGLTDAFDNQKYRLPHLAGTITNLDKGSVRKSILSIESELKRRERIFHDAKEATSEATMDIYKYQKLYRQGVVKEPLPHLFIISDEFAELKSQEPEFLNQLVSTARIGRSLGMHLILATQKPGGVVSDEIWTNSRFKVCLKVQDKNDSMEMLKRPDAAELTNAGRFYLQVGYNEMFSLGQAAWCGAYYPDKDIYVREDDKDIDIIDESGRVVDKIKYAKQTDDSKNGEQIANIMAHLHRLAEAEEISERQLWLPDIPERIYLDELIGKYGYTDTASGDLTAVIGEMDNPYTVEQSLLTVNYTVDGNAVVYGNGSSGVDDFIRTSLFSMFERYTPEEFNAYLLDFGSECLKVYESMPQVGGVLLDGDDERIYNLFVKLRSEIKTRKKLLADHNGDIRRYNAENPEKLPQILVVVHNLSNFFEFYDEYEDAFVSITRDCVKYGIYFLISAGSANGIRYRVSQNFNRKFVLKLNDTTDYASILGSTSGMEPEKYAGRGMIKEKKNVYLFQTAFITYEDAKVNEYIKKYAEVLNGKYGDRRAWRVPVMPDFLSAADYRKEEADLTQVVLGVEYGVYTEVAFSLKEHPVFPIIGQSVEEAYYLAAGIAEQYAGCAGLDVREIDFAAATTEEIENIVDVAVARNTDYKTTNGNPTVDMSPVIYLVKNYGKGNSEDFDNLLDAAQAFWNLYYLICDSEEGARRYNYNAWFAKKITHAVWIGKGVHSQSVYSRDELRGYPDEIQPLSGYYLHEKGVKKLKFIMPERLREEFEDE